MKLQLLAAFYLLAIGACTHHAEIRTESAPAVIGPAGDAIIAANDPVEATLERDLVKGPQAAKTVNNVNTFVGVAGGVVTALISAGNTAKFTGAETSLVAGGLALVSNQKQAPDDAQSCSKAYLTAKAAWNSAKEGGEPTVNDFNALQNAILNIHSSCPAFHLPSTVV